VVGVPFEYVLRWDWVVGAATWIACGIALLPAIAERAREWVSVSLVAACALGSAVLLAVVSVSAVWAVKPYPVLSTAAHALVVSSAPELRRAPGPIWVEADFWSVFLADGVISGLDERDIPANFPYPLLGAPGADARHPSGTSVFVAFGRDIAAYASNPRFIEIASSGTDPTTRGALFARRVDVVLGAGGVVGWRR
jgi:hypothetical protein